MTIEVGNPPKGKKGKLGRGETQPPAEQPKQDIARGVKKPIQLKLDVDTIREFKQLAFDREMNMNELFVEMLRSYQGQ